MSAIELKNFSKKYGNFTAVNALNLSVQKGEIVGFVGKNGAGKSTTIRSILDIIHPTHGGITVLGMNSVQSSKEMKKRVSYVPSESSFYDDVTVRRLLLFAMQFADSTIEEMQQLAEYFELDLSKKVTELSLGNRKKVSIVQGFLKKAELMILDEPTSGLDPLMQKKFFDLLLKQKQSGKTIFLSSHNLDEIEKYCDRVAIIKDGELVDFFDMKDVKHRHTQTVFYETAEGETESFEIDGDINTLVAKLASLDLKRLEIKTKTVGEEFIGYYEGSELL